MSLNSVLADAFTLANRRPGAILLDLLWKLIWLVLASSAVLGLAAWIYWRTGSIRLTAPGGMWSNPVSLMILARQIWSRYASMVSWVVVVFVGLAFISWMLLESYFRSGFLANSDDAFFENAGRHFKVFIASSTLKQLLLAAFSTLMLLIGFQPYLTTPIGEWSGLLADSRGAILIAIGMAAVVWFVLTVFETAIRSNSVDELGRDLFLVAGVIGTLVFFEAMMIASALALAVIVASFVTDAKGTAMLVIGGLCAAALLTLLHTYLMIVRYSALHVLARTSSVPQGPGIIGHVDEFRDRSHPRFWFPVHPVDRTPHS
jgi:hypothetical protein